MTTTNNILGKLGGTPASTKDFDEIRRNFAGSIRTIQSLAENFGRALAQRAPEAPAPEYKFDGPAPT